MKQTQGTLWIDVTMLINWSGHLTGIQRVEYNLAKRYADQEKVKFFVFHKDRQLFTEFDFGHIDRRIKELQHKARDTITEVGTDSFVRQILLSAKHIVKPVLPPASRAYLRRQYHRLRHLRSHIAEPDTPVIFKSEDTLLILSGDWSDNTFANLIARRRAKTHFKIVQIVYDMLPAFFPGYFVPDMPGQFSRYMEKMFSIADGVLTISESTRRDVQAFMKARSQSPVAVHVFRLGDDFMEQKPVKPDLPVQNGKYVLCVCTIEARKNHMLLYYAAREAIHRGEDFPTVVLVGRHGWLANDFLYLIQNDPVLSKKFLFTNCNDQELAWLYRNCNFTVFPSFYEGWGLMVSESLFYGKFCLSSNTSSMPEIAGKLIDYFSPNDPIAMLEKVQLYQNDPGLLKQKEAAIKTKYRPTSWDDAFVAVKKFVEKV